MKDEVNKKAFDHFAKDAKGASGSETSDISQRFDSMNVLYFFHITCINTFSSSGLKTEDELIPSPVICLSVLTKNMVSSAKFMVTVIQMSG